MESVFISRFTLTLQQNCKMLDTQNCLQHHIKNANAARFLFSQPSTLPKDAPAKFDIPTTFGLRFYSKFCSSYSIAPSRSAKSETVTLKTRSETCACVPYDLYGDQALLCFTLRNLCKPKMLLRDRLQGDMLHATSHPQLVSQRHCNTSNRRNCIV